MSSKDKKKSLPRLQVGVWGDTPVLVAPNKAIQDLWREQYPKIKIVLQEPLEETPNEG